MLEESVISTVSSLVNQLFSIKVIYEGTVFNKGDWEYIDVIYAEEDGSSTDLYSCVISDEERNWIKFYVEVSPRTNRIEEIDLNCVDIGLRSKDNCIDCINLICN